MVSTYTSFLFICYLPMISTTLIMIYKNSRFEPVNNQSIAYNISAIESQNICICRCLMNSTCATAMYNGQYQLCTLYRAYLQSAQLRAVAIESNSSVIGLRSSSDSTSPSATTIGTSIQSTTQIAPPTSTKAIGTSTTTSVAGITAVTTCTTLVNFDDILAPLSTSDLIPNGYKHLNWTNAHYINVSSMPISSGYANGVRSQPFVLYNPTGGNITISTANSTRFSFDSLYLTSAWRDYLNVTIKTIRNGFITSVSVFSAMTEYPTTVFCFLCTNIDALVLQSDGGIPSTNYVPNGTQFIIDDLCISFGH